MRADRHPDEARRLRALRSYGVLDTPREADFDEIAALAAQICGTPISLISLVEEDRQWFKAKVGTDADQTPMESSICVHALLQKGLVEISDTTLDPRSKDNPLVTGEPNLRFYAGSVLETEDGLPLGTLCVLDTVPRTLSEVQREALKVLGRQVMTQLELRRKLKELELARLERMEADQRAETDRDFIRLVTDRLPVRVAYIDTDYRYRFINDAYEKQLGLVQEQVIGRTVTEVLGEGMYKFAEPLMERAFKGETFSVDLVVPYIGNDQMAHATYVPDFGPDGVVRGLVVHVLDVTKQRNIERALRESEHSRKLALESAKIGAWNIKLPSMEMTTDERFQIIFCGLAGDMTYEEAFAMIHEDDRQMVRDKVAAACNPANPAPYAAEYRTVHPDGTIHWVFAQGQANFPLGKPDEPPTSFDGTVLEITDRKLLEQEREEVVNLFVNLADNVDQLAWIADSTGAITWYNQRWYEYTGTTYDEMAGWGWQSVHDPAVLASVMERWKLSIGNGTRFEMEFPLLGADGAFRMFLTRANPIKDEQGNVVRWFGTNTDMQFQKEVEARLEQHIEERTIRLTRANRDLTEFSYSVAHDLRAPLRAIVSTSRILLEDDPGNLGDEQRELLMRQAKNGVRLAGLVDDLLAFGRLTNSELKRERVDLTATTQTVIEELRAIDKVNGCRFSVEAGMEAFGDRRLLSYALTNMIDNACKFSPGGGLVSVGRSGKAFFVRDEGIGFEMRHAAKVFVAFERLVAQDAFPGTGVGLANVKRIIERHGGSIWAESELGVGSTFWFTLESG